MILDEEREGGNQVIACHRAEPFGLILINCYTRALYPS